MTVMLANVFTKTTRDRWKSTVIGAVALALLLVFGMAVYRDIDVSFWDDLPEAFRNMFGIPEGADVGGLAYGAIYSGYGALAMAGIAIAAGSASIAGEERAGTFGLLLDNPISRTRVVAEKAASLLVVTLGGFVILWVAAVGAPVLLDVEIGSMQVTALVVMMFLNALFYGYLAMALSAWSGRTSIAVGVPAAILVVSFVAVGLLPLIDSLAELARVFPWYYFSSSDPAMNGVALGDAAVLVGGSLVFVAAGLVGVARRDLRGQTTGTGLIDRLRANDMTRRMADAVAGRARVSAIWIKTASEHQGLLFITSLVIVAMAVMIGPMFNLLDDSMASLADQFPEDLLALFGGGDLATPEGFYQIEVFGLMAPIAVLTVAIAIGAGAIAGEEKRSTMGLLLANPVRRSTIVLQKTVTMVLYAAIVGLATFVGVAAGSILGSLGMDLSAVAAACALLTLLGIAFGAFAMALGGLTGRMGIAVYGSVGVAVVAYIANGFLPLNDATEAWARLSPFHYYLGADPLLAGMSWGHAAVLVALAMVGVVVAIAGFQRRDLRQRG